MRARHKLLVVGGIAVVVTTVALLFYDLNQSPKLNVENDLLLSVVLDCAGDLSAVAAPGTATSADMVWAPSATACRTYSSPGHHYLGCFLYDGDPVPTTVILSSRLSKVTTSECSS